MILGLRSMETAVRAVRTAHGVVSKKTNRESCFGIDVDDLLSYTSPKEVRIHDRTLGCIYYLLLLIIVTYIFVYQIIFQNSYLKMATPVPSIRPVLQQPTLDNCSPDKQSCEDVVAGAALPPYCQRDNCRYLDGIEATPLLGSREIMVSTYVEEFNNTRNLECNVSSCRKMWDTAQRTSYFVAGIEEYTLSIDHSIEVPELGLQTSAANMDGWLWIDQDGPMQQELCKTRSGAIDERYKKTDVAPCYIPADIILLPGNIDVFRISTLLRTVGFDLDTTMSSQVEQADNSLRRRGFQMVLEIHYYNVVQNQPGVRPTRYYYRLSALAAPYSFRFLTKDPSLENRVKTKARGIYMSIVVTGSLGKPDFLTLLTTVVASMALLAVANLVVISLAKMLLKRRPYYKAMMIQESPDFSTVQEFEALTPEQLEQRLVENGLKTTGTAPMKILRLLNKQTQEKDVEAKSFKKTGRSMSRLGDLSAPEAPPEQPQESTSEAKGSRFGISVFSPKRVSQRVAPSP